jgi:hypothetical protein
MRCRTIFNYFGANPHGPKGSPSLRKNEHDIRLSKSVPNRRATDAHRSPKPQTFGT